MCQMCAHFWLYAEARTGSIWLDVSDVYCFYALFCFGLLVLCYLFFELHTHWQRTEMNKRRGIMNGREEKRSTENRSERRKTEHWVE